MVDQRKTVVFGPSVDLSFDEGYKSIVMLRKGSKKNKYDVLLFNRGAVGLNNLS